MSLRDNRAGEIEDPVVAEALQHFKSSVDAWSDAAYARPRMTAGPARHGHGWRLAAGWALGCVVVASTATAGMYQHQHRQELARMAAARAAQQARIVAEQRAAAAQAKDEDLLATVDSDISRQVPTALEPLAQMMNDDETKDNGVK